MIARLLRTAAAWWRNRRAPRGEVVHGWMLRAESEAMLDAAHALAGRADALFAKAAAAPRLSAAQYRLTLLGYATQCESDALRWRAGGDDETAAEYTAAAAEWRAMAAQFKPWRVESHA
jgi:hypothetical protein